MPKKVSARKTFSQAEISFESEGCPSTTECFGKMHRGEKAKKGVLHNHSENCKDIIQKLWQCVQVALKSYLKSVLVILEPQIYVVVEQFVAENISLLSGRLVFIL